MSWGLPIGGLCRESPGLPPALPTRLPPPPPAMGHRQRSRRWGRRCCFLHQTHYRFITRTPQVFLSADADSQNTPRQWVTHKAGLCPPAQSGAKGLSPTEHLRPSAASSAWDFRGEAVPTAVQRRYKFLL